MNVFDIKSEDRETVYRDLRATLEQEYSCHVGPYAERCMRTHRTKLIEAGRDEKADAEEERFNEAQASYDRGVHEKFLLAILTGRYDSVLREKPTCGYSSDKTWNEEIINACGLRRKELDIV